MLRTLNSAFSDIYGGFRLRSLCFALAHEDIGDQYRRTTIGPTWLLVNYLAFAATFLVVFNKGTGPGYPAYMATGLLVWFYMMEVINQAVTLFVREENMIKGTSLPLTVYVMRLSLQLIIRGVYALVGCIMVLAVYHTALMPGSVAALLGVLLIVAITPAVVTVFAIAGAFFPDIQYVIPHIMRIGMFLTPVFWVHDNSGGARGILSHWNPFTYFIDLVRLPITTGTIPLDSFKFCVVVGVAFWISAILLLGRFRREIVFVL